jgi:hypothetical protein
MRRRTPLPRTVALAAAVIVPVVVALALVPWRSDMSPANVALALMATVVALAATGGWQAGAVAAVSSSVAFDFFHTRPYLSLRITSHDDVETTVLLLAAGLVVGVLAARAHFDRATAEAGRSQLGRIYRLAEEVVDGTDAAQVILDAERELTGLLDLRGCRFEAPPFRQPYVRIERGELPTVGQPASIRGRRELADEMLLPAGGVELPVLAHGQPVGRFVLLPRSDGALSLEQHVVAVALADQVGAALATRHPVPDRRDTSNG